ncbi:hypothetical protein SUDANB121_03073 [Nocardiopsis dassonvillei]
MRAVERSDHRRGLKFSTMGKPRRPGTSRVLADLLA